MKKNSIGFLSMYLVSEFACDCFLFPLFAVDPCHKCDPLNAVCKHDKCVCVDGYKGNGEICDCK